METVPGITLFTSNNLEVDEGLSKIEDLESFFSQVIPHIVPCHAICLDTAMRGNLKGVATDCE